MKLRIEPLHFSAGRPVAILNEKTANKLSIHVGDRILIIRGKRKIISVVDLAVKLLAEDEIVVSTEILEALKARPRNLVEVSITTKPRSIEFIRKKFDGKSLNKGEYGIIIKDISNNALTEAEIAYFISAVSKSETSLQEVKYLTEAIAETGNKLVLKNGKIAEKHSIGGVPGNRTTPIVTSICASAGLIVPKTSSRAITSAAGTADVIEVIADVEFSISELKKIIKKTNACLVWGGNLGLAPTDNKIIQVEKLLSIDAEPHMLSSIISKKLASGSKYVVIDLPYDKTAKVTKKEALNLKKNFESLTKYFKIKTRCFLTYGSQPIGRGIGPILELRDVLAVLENKNPPTDLRKKSLFLASKLLELAGNVREGKGMEMAKKILDSGQAFKKFKEIIEAQNGKIKKLIPGKYSYVILSKKNSKIKEINNKKIAQLARVAGSPADKGAGLFLFKKVGESVKKREPVLKIYAESREKLKYAIKFYKKTVPIKLK